MADDKYKGDVHPIYNPNTQKLDQVAVPEGSSWQDLHQALGDFHQTVQLPAKQPSATGSLEYQPQFKAAAKNAYDKSGRGHLLRETAFSVSPTGQTSALTIYDSKPGDVPSDTFTMNSGDMATFIRTR